MNVEGGRNVRNREFPRIEVAQEQEQEPVQMPPSKNVLAQIKASKGFGVLKNIGRVTAGSLGIGGLVVLSPLWALSYLVVGALPIKIKASEDGKQHIYASQVARKYKDIYFGAYKKIFKWIKSPGKPPAQQEVGYQFSQAGGRNRVNDRREPVMNPPLERGEVGIGIAQNNPVPQNDNPVPQNVGEVGQRPARRGQRRERVGGAERPSVQRARTQKLAEEIKEDHKRNEEFRKRMKEKYGESFKPKIRPRQAPVEF